MWAICVLALADVRKDCTVDRATTVVAILASLPIQDRRLDKVLLVLPVSVPLSPDDLWSVVSS